MSLSMYQASVPVFVRQFGALSKILGKAEAFAAEQAIDPATLIAARLAPDMYPFSKQIQIASDIVKGGIARLAGIEPPAFDDTETTFAELEERIGKTVGFIASVPADQIDGSETRAILLKAGGNEYPFVGQDYLLHFVLPNFFFHVTAAYALLRQAGVPLGKMDFLAA